MISIFIKCHSYILPTISLFSWELNQLTFMALSVSMLYVIHLNSHMYSAHSGKDWQKEKQFLTIKFLMAFSGTSSHWGPTFFPYLWKSKQILIFNSFYSNPYTRLLMFFKQINESNLLISKKDKWYLHTTDPKALKKIKIQSPLEPEERHGLTAGTSGSLFWPATALKAGKKKGSSLSTHRPLLPVRTSNLLGACPGFS